MLVDDENLEETEFRWGDVWPAARTFHPAVVPLPVSFPLVQPVWNLEFVVNNIRKHFPLAGEAGCDSNQATNPAGQICKHRTDEGGLLLLNVERVKLS